MSEQSSDRPESQGGAEPSGDIASRYSQIAQERLEADRERAANELERAAEAVRERSAQAGNQVAGTMDRTAGYLHEHTTGEMWGGVEQYVRKHRAVAIAGGVSAAFLIAMILHRSPHKEAE